LISFLIFLSISRKCATLLDFTRYIFVLLNTRSYLITFRLLLKIFVFQDLSGIYLTNKPENNPGLIDIL